MSSMGVTASWTAQTLETLVCHYRLCRGLCDRFSGLKLEDRNDSDHCGWGRDAGTRAAAEFLTNPQSISELVKSLPQGLEKKNVQIVLHTTVTDQLPSAPDVVATYCW